MTASDPGLLVLHAVRLLGFAPTERVAARFGLDAHDTAEALEDARARGWVEWSSFGDAAGWSLTPRGKAEGERLLAAELDATGRRDLVHRTYLDFLELNGCLLRAVTDWQTRPAAGDPLAANDHQDLRWDRRTLGSLDELGIRLRPLAAVLADTLDRLDGYGTRFAAALAEVERGDRRWVDALEVDSCHTVWFQLHEDLLATLGIARGQAQP
ncbi:transcriptional regulator [Nocardioides euryhalodurans]|uniref:Transcriptional regulator n=1 Tax=Nocardioides euryhalodurans TaxID=2518370 RepID=A0A4P7GGN6_9ACTN|nr:transcriptional regulator [Nocardioides euryhalodurans]QBR90976.1 transcriptional regulator [Nocardioides euryhalodurans]